MNEIVLILYIIFGLIIISGYIKIGINYNNFKDRIFGKVKNDNLKNFYKLAVFFSFIFGIYLMYYFIEVKNDEEFTLYFGLSIFLFFSAVWAWFPFDYSKVVLFFVSVGSLLLLINVCLQKDKNLLTILAIVSCVFLFIQTFILDFIIWNFGTTLITF